MGEGEEVSPLQLLIERAAQAALALSGNYDHPEGPEALAGDLQTAIVAVEAHTDPHVHDNELAWLAVIPSEGYASIVEAGQGGRIIADQLFPEDARRIVACVNLLRGLPTERIEAAQFASHNG